MESGASAHAPRVWLLLGHKAGDNAQVRSLAAALGWPAEAHHLRYRATEILTNRLLGPNLAGIDAASAAGLVPPWPDLLLTSGRRNEPVARWIRQASGNQTRLVHLGRPWAALDCFDLIVSTPQYRLPAADNVLEIDLPLHGIDAAKLEAARTRWSAELAGLPGPRIAVLVGGNSGSFLMTSDRVRQMLDQACEMARSTGGSLLITDSARTPAAVRECLFRPLDVPHTAFRWGTPAAENPYTGFLALADQFIVTGDSVSMVAEACATRQAGLFTASASAPFAHRQGG